MSDKNNIQLVRYVGADRIARQFDVSTRTVRRWIETGLLPAVKVGGVLRVAEDDLQAFTVRAKVEARAMEPA